MPEFWDTYALARQYGSHWQYRMRWNGKWYYASGKESAIEMAQKLFDSTPPKERLTPAQIMQAEEEDFVKGMDLRYGKLSNRELEEYMGNLDRQIQSLQKAGRREFNGNGGRRTAAAVSNEAAREAGDEKLKIKRYLAARSHQQLQTGSGVPV